MVKGSPDRQGSPPVDRRPVLVAVDFSEDSEGALLWACEFATQVGAEVVALHVIHDPIETPGSYRKSEGDVLRPTEDVATDRLNEFIAKVARSHPSLSAFGTLKTSLVQGIPETRILEVAKKVDARMIVIGSRGLTGLPHLLMGSKAERVAQLSPRPVTIVKRRQRDD